MHRIVPLILSALLLIATLSTANASDEKLNVVSTIRPIQAIVLTIAGEHVDATQIIPDYASPHHYSFKPSDIRRIQKADVIFRVDEFMETNLNKSFNKLPKDKIIIALADDKNIHLLDQDSKHNHEKEKEDDHDEHKHKNESGHEEDHAKEDKHDEHEHEGHNDKDLHIWTSPENTLVMANAIATKLGELDSDNAETYQANLAAFTAKINELTLKIKSELEPLKNKPYIVFHNSWQYFGHQFGLESPTVFDPQENITAGIKSIRAIQTEIKEKNIGCIFSDPSIKKERVSFIIDKFKINAVEIDALNRGSKLNNNSSVEYFNYLSNKVRTCLAP